MEAGRSLDALIAEKVMGWCRINSPDEQTRAYLWFREHKGSVQRRGYKGFVTTNGRGTTPSVSQLWEPSTDIAAAWEVLEKLLADGYTVEVYSPGALINDEFGSYSVGWSVVFYAWGQPTLPSGRAGRSIDLFGDKSKGTQIDTVLLAICLAALKAVGAVE